MSAPVFRLKGGGWYETDFKSDQDSKRNLADRPEDAPKEDKKEGAAAESKEAPATDAKSDKPAEKPVEKAGSGESAKKTAARATQGRPVAHKPNARKAAKRPARPATKRRSREAGTRPIALGPRPGCRPYGPGLPRPVPSLSIARFPCGF